MKKDWTTMKLLILYIVLILILILISSCDVRVKPDFVKGGKEYVVSENCVKSHNVSEYSYHYGYNMLDGKFNWHWGMDTKTICDSVKLDTIEVNKEKKYYEIRN